MGYPRFRPVSGKLTATALTVAGAMRNFAIAGLYAATMIFALAIAAPAPAQVTVQIGSPQVPGFSNNYPWFNDVPQYEGNQSFRWFLANNPDIAQSLSQNPSRLYDSEWRSQFPALEEYLANHPYEWQALNGEYWSEGPAETQWGDYDNGQWRDAYWWHQNNPNWFYDNHVSWASLDSRWLAQDGAYDQQHQWHYGEWWYNQNPSWVTTNHRNWINQHRSWARPAEQQNYRQQHAMRETNQQPLPLHQNADSLHREQNQHAADQQQANLERQQTMHANLQQQQTMRENNLRQQQANQEAIHENQQRLSDQRQANLEQQQNLREENQRQQQANREQLQAGHQENQQAVRQQHSQQQQAMHQEQQAREQQTRPRPVNSVPQHRQENERQSHGNGDNQPK